MDQPFLTRKFVARFLTVFSCFLVLLSLITIPIVTLCSRDVEEQNRSLFQQTMSYQLEQADIQMDSLSAQLQYFCVDDKNFIALSNPNLMLDYLSLRDFQKDLASLVSGYSYVEDVVLVTRNDLIITANLSIPNRALITELFFKQFFVTDALHTPEDLRALGQALHCLAISEQSSGKHYLALAASHPLFNANAQPVAHSLITLDLDRLLRDVIPEEFSASAQVRVSHREKELLLRPAEKLDDPTTITVRGPRTGVQIEITLPSKLLNHSIESILTALWLLMGTALLGGLVLTVVFLMITGWPMRRLHQLAQAVTPSIPSRNEYEYIEGALSQLGHSLAKSREEFAMQRTMLQQTVLERAMMGVTVEREEFNALFPDFPQHYSVVLVQISVGEDVPNAVDFALSERLIMEHFLSNHFMERIPCLQLSAGLTALVLPEGAGGEEALETLRQAFMNHYKLPVNVFWGDRVSGENMLGEAYASAKYIQSLATCYIEKRVWHRGNFPEQPSISNIDYNVFQNLYESLFNGRREKAMECLERLRLTLPNPSGSAHSNRRTLEFVHSIFIRVKQERFELLSGVALPFPDSQQPLADYLRILKENICLLCDALCQCDSQSASFGQKIVDWLDGNFTDPDLYVKTLTTHFNINEKMLQTAMHDVTGTSFADYLENKRLTHAAALLKSTSLNVKEISQQSGFALYNTFYKSFKRRYGCSPLEYRAQSEG